MDATSPRRGRGDAPSAAVEELHPQSGPRRGLRDGAVVHDPLVSADTKATMRAVEAYGGSVRWLRTSRRSK